jgi:hypothetical protein
MAQAPEEIRERREPAEQIFVPRGAAQEAALARFLAGGKWRLLARWLGLAIFIFGAILLAWVFWQALAGFQNFTRPDYLSGQLNRVQGDTPVAIIIANIVVFGTQQLRVFVVFFIGFMACVI